VNKTGNLRVAPTPSMSVTLMDTQEIFLEVSKGEQKI
jgi:hypothetical protein